jgi:hypothetical protein
MAKPKFDVSVNGVGLNTFGLTDKYTIDPWALLTFGLIWQCGNHWGPAPWSNVTLTTWSAYSNFGVTTSWTDYGAFGVTTTWTDYTPEGVEDC